jgi:hypothetical protein
MVESKFPVMVTSIPGAPWLGEKPAMTGRGGPALFLHAAKHKKKRKTDSRQFLIQHS